jgi:hypothetical protein
MLKKIGTIPAKTLQTNDRIKIGGQFHRITASRSGFIGQWKLFTQLDATNISCSIAMELSDDIPFDVYRNID